MNHTESRLTAHAPRPLPIQAKKPEVVSKRPLVSPSPMTLLKIGLCKARHPIQTNDGEPIEDFLFSQNVEDVHDYSAQEERVQLILVAKEPSRIELYVTGLTPVLISTLNAIQKYNESNYGAIHSVKLMNYDRDSQQYQSQEVSNLTKSLINEY